MVSTAESNIHSYTHRFLLAAHILFGVLWHKRTISTRIALSSVSMLSFRVQSRRTGSAFRIT